MPREPAPETTGRSRQSPAKSAGRTAGAAVADGPVGSEIRHACAQLQLGETANDIALRLLQHLSLAAPEQGLVGVPRRQAIPRPSRAATLTPC